MDLEAQCAELQTDELVVLESIYPEQIELHPNPSNRPGRLLSLTIPIVLPEKTAVHLALVEHSDRAKSSAAAIHPPASASCASATLHITHLPALTFRLLLPATYPLASPPKAISSRAPLPRAEGRGPAWLPRAVLTRAHAKLEEMWREDMSGTGASGEGQGILWRWWEWISGGDFLVDCGLLRDDELHLTVPPTLSLTTFHTLLKTYNAQQMHSDFESTAFSCTICFESRKGRRCVQMPCGCVFCHDCLGACWSLAITEGTLEAVACPSPTCVKRRATAPIAARAAADRPAQDVAAGAERGDTSEVDATLVESVVGPELRARWEDLKARRRAEVDPTYCICPREQCQAPVPPPAPPDKTEQRASAPSRVIRLSDIASPASASASSSASAVPSRTTSTPPQSDDRWDRYRQCPTCSYSFCLYCSSTWHGPHTPCAFPQTSAIVVEYLAHPEGSPARALIEARRGKKNMERMVARYLEDEENKKWLDERTRACAGCGVRVEKSHGCNHMTCGRCGAHFCYRCGESLRPADPYAHYRKPGSCFERLFDQEEIARFERETAGVGGGGAAGPGDWGEFPPHGLGAQLVGDEWGPRGVWEW